MSTSLVSSQLASATSWKSSIFQNVAKLAGAAGVSCLLTILLTPVLTRLYSPSEFGLLAVFASVLNIVTTPASLRYEFAIPLAKTSKDTRDISYLALLLLAGTSASLLVLIIISKLSGTSWQWIENLGIGVWLLPLGMLALGAYQVLNYWAVKGLNFSNLALAGFMRNFAEVLIQILLGLLSIGAVGLMLGVVAGNVFGLLVIAWPLVAKGQLTLSLPKFNQIRRVAYKYRRFAYFSTPSSICNIVGAKLPTLLLASCYSLEVAGWFVLAERVLALPTRLVGKAVSDVYFGEAAKQVHDNPGELSVMLRHLTYRLLPVSLLIFITVLVASPYFGWFFGEKWFEAGRLCKILAVVFSVRFLVLSTTLLTTYGVNQWQLGWDILRLVLVASSLVGSYLLGLSVESAIICYAVVSVFSLLVLYALNVLAIKRLMNQAGEGQAFDS